MNWSNNRRSRIDKDNDCLNILFEICFIPILSRTFLTLICIFYEKKKKKKTYAYIILVVLFTFNKYWMYTYLFSVIIILNYFNWRFVYLFICLFACRSVFVYFIRNATHYTYSNICSGHYTSTLGITGSHHIAKCGAMV
jgi:hypothetical protein